MDTATDSSEPPRLEVHVDPRAALTRAKLLQGGVLGVIALALSVRFPYTIGASIALPVLFAWVGYRLARPRPRALTVRFFDDVIELEAENFIGRTSWASVDSVTSTSEGAVLAFSHGGRLVIPKAQLPVDRRVLLDALPPHLRVAPARAPAAEQTRRQRVVAWIVAIVAFFVLYQLVAFR